MMRHGLLGCAPLVLLLATTSCKKDEPAPAEKASAAGATTSGAKADTPSTGSGVFSAFEGEVELKFVPAKDKKPAVPIHLLVKGNRFRFDVPEGGSMPPGVGKAYVIVSAGEKKLEAVLPEKKQVIGFDFEKLGKDLEGMKPPGAPPSKPSEPPTVKKTGTKDTVAGFSCENWDITSHDGNRAQLCVADEVTPWFSAPALGVPLEHAWVKELVDGKHFPVRFIGFDQSGVEEGRAELVKAEKKPLADDLFVVPADYERLDLGQWFQKMMGGMMPPGAMSAGPKGISLGADGLPTNLPPEVRKQIEAMRAKGGAPPARPAP